MVALEPGGPQFGNVDTAKITTGPRNPNSWGLTNARYEYDPPAAAPGDLKVKLEIETGAWSRRSYAITKHQHLEREATNRVTVQISLSRAELFRTTPGRAARATNLRPHRNRSCCDPRFAPDDDGMVTAPEPGKCCAAQQPW